MRTDIQMFPWHVACCTAPMSRRWLGWTAAGALMRLGKPHGVAAMGDAVNAVSRADTVRSPRTTRFASVGFEGIGFPQEDTMRNEQLFFRRLTPIAIAVLAISACHDAAPRVTGISASTQPQLGGPHVVRAPASKYFVEHERVRGRGERSRAGGCILSGADTLSPGQRVGERLVEYDPTSCAYIMARGDWLPKPATRTSSRKTRQSPAFGRPTPSGPVVAQGPAAAVASGSAWQRLFYEDPVQINVTETLLEVYYEISGGCVSWSSSTHTTTWLDQSGWALDFDDHYQVQGCSAWQHFGEAYFSNDSFCYPGITYNDYYTNEVTPLSDGRVAYSYSADAYGACSSFLTFGREKNA
jgi:hypothetical protein